jgi:hypothetical protein
MNCEQIQEQLSAYIDERLDETSRGVIRDHLESCVRCRAEITAFVRTKQGVAGLPSLEPPPGFSNNVMARIREKAEHTSHWRRLIFPLWAKIPLHATTILLIAGLAIYLYELNQPPPITKTPSGSLSTPPPHEEGLRTDLDKPTVLPDAAAPRSQAAPAQSREVDRLILTEKNAPSAAKEKSPKAFQSKTPDAFLAAKAAPTADHELTLTAKEPFKDQKQLTGNLSAIAKQVDGNVLSSGKKTEPSVVGGFSQRQAPEPYTVWLTIPSDRYPQFKAELARLGRIESESPSAPAPALAGKSSELTAPSTGTPSSHQLRIKLTIRAPQQPAP